MKCKALVVLAVFIAAPLSSSAFAAAVPTRPALQLLLAGGGTLEDFESFNIAPGTGAILNCNPINNAVFCNTQGPDLVVPGVSFQGTLLQWNGADNSALSSTREILDASASPLNINFSVFVNAFGVDLHTFEFNNTATRVDIFAPDDTTLIGTLPFVPLPVTGMPVFVGWTDPGGIGLVRLTSLAVPPNPPLTTIIDNLEFGQVTAIPEPSTYALMLAGLGIVGFVARRRKRRTGATA